MKKIISFFKTDIKIINSYFLLAVIFIILISIGYSSYALFSFTKTSSNVIEGKVGKINYTTNFEYTGECTTYIVKSNGYYNLEVWGAQGGNYNTTYVGGLGGYSKGIVHLTKGTTLYVCVGGQPQTVTTASGGGGGFYGGGAGTSYSDSTNYDKYSGGGSGYVYTSSTASSYPSGCLLNSTYYLTVASTTEAINTGHGKATITYIGKNKPIGVDTLIALTDNKDNSGLYTITHAKDSTLQIGNDKDITEYRYRGASPKNYVTFNNEVWRILGIFPVENENGVIENRIKLIRNESIGNNYWNKCTDTNDDKICDDTNKYYNDWTGATLQTELNTTYLNSLDSTSKSMIGNTKYYLGGKETYYNNGLAYTPLQFYSYERKIKNTTSNEFYNGTNPNSWVGKLGLMYLSDYGYAASDECTQKLEKYDNTTCKTNNWLFKGNTEWTLPQNAFDISRVVCVETAGSVSGGSIVYYHQDGVRPVLYLISSAQITGGSGTSSDPYTLGL